MDMQVLNNSKVYTRKKVAEMVGANFDSMVFKSRNNTTGETTYTATYIKSGTPYSVDIVFKDGINGTNGVNGINAPLITGISFSGDDMVFAFNDASTRTISNAKITLKGDAGVTTLSIFTTDDLPEGTNNKYVTATNKTNWDSKADGVHTHTTTDINNINIVSPTNGQSLVYNAVNSKFENKTISNTDELVKMVNTDVTGKYLNDLLDHATIENVGGAIVAKTLQGLTVSIAEINTLQGMTGNIKSILDSLASAGMTYTGIVNTKADLNLITGMLVGNVKIVLVDETNTNKRMTYIYSGTVWESLGESNITIRDFAINPINLINEVTGILPQANMNLTDVVKTSDLSNYTNTTTLEADYAKKTDIGGKANSTDVYSITQADTLLSNKADKVTGKSLIEDAEITRLASITNYDHTNVDSHMSDNTIHTTSTEKTTWNGKANNIDNSRTTTAKDVTGSINEINASVGGLNYTRGYLATATPSITDYNQLVSNGKYKVTDISTNNPDNSTSSTFLVDVFAMSSLYVFQIAYCLYSNLSNTSKKYMRSSTNGTWTSWEQIITNKIDTTPLTPQNNFTVIGGYANNVRRNNNIIDFEATLYTGTIPTVDTVIFTIPYSVKHRTLLNCLGSNGKMYAVNLSGNNVSWNGIQGNATADLTFIVLSGMALI